MELLTKDDLTPTELYEYYNLVKQIKKLREVKAPCSYDLKFFRNKKKELIYSFYVFFSDGKRFYRPRKHYFKYDEMKAKINEYIALCSELMESNEIEKITALRDYLLNNNNLSLKIELIGLNKAKATMKGTDIYISDFKSVANFLRENYLKNSFIYDSKPSFIGFINVAERKITETLNFNEFYNSPNKFKDKPSFIILDGEISEDIPSWIRTEIRLI